MSECPHCGGEIVITASISAGPDPPNLRRKSGVSVDANPAQIVAQIDFAHGSKDLDLNSSTESRNRYNKGYSEGFEVFWKVYPLHRNKRKAFLAWKNANRRAPADQILAGALTYRNDPNRLAEFTKYAEGWLNGDGWDDEPLPARIDRNRREERPAPMTSGEMARYLEQALSTDE